MVKNKTLPATQWKIKEAVNKEVETALSREFVFTRLFPKFHNREIVNLEDAHRYLNPSLNYLHSPFLLKDMKKGVSRLFKAIYNHEKS